MPSIDDLRTNEILPFAVYLVAFLGLGTLLLVLLASFRFPRFRSFVCWSIARWVDPDRFDEGSYLYDVALALTVWLDPMQHRFTIDEVVSDHGNGGWLLTGKPQVTVSRTLNSPSRDYLLGKQIGSSAAYQTFETSNQRYLVKLARNANGDRLLAKEATVLDHLCSRAIDATYENYLPLRMQRFQAGNRTALAYPYEPQQLFSARQIRRIHPNGVSGVHLAWMFNRMLEVIGFAHQQGTVHGAVMPQHMLFETEAHGLKLVDWTHAKRFGDRITFVPRRYREWYPQDGFMIARPNLDIYMAAKSTLFLAGGDVSSNRFPDALPKPIRQFLKSCLLDSPNMRPGDAWELHEGFRDLLDVVYGGAKFHQLSMSQ